LEQLYVTHCLYGEGRSRQAGFNVRASSSEDPLILRFAVEYPAYEVPAGMTDAGNEAAPRRLALVRIPGGKSALIHSVHLTEDDKGRPNNYFSHMLILPEVKTSTAVATWASPGWATHCPADIDSILPALGELPAGGSINDSAVTAFLRGSESEDSEHSGFLYPQRLAADRDRRRDLLRMVLRGCQLTLEAPASAPRNRLFILAEPGLTALLLYAASRLLPEALAAKLTFSTYEHARRDLRGYRHARVVGTYTTDTSRGLEREFYTDRGYALDTFNHEFSHELDGQRPAEIEDWIELAARGEWNTLDRVYNMLGDKHQSLLTFHEAREAYHLSNRLASGEASAQDLLNLRESASGPALLEKYQDQVWPLIREMSLTDLHFREAFAGTMAEHVAELEHHAAEALRRPPPSDWQSHWQLLRYALKDEPTRLWGTFQRLIPAPPYPPELRLALLEELQILAPRYRAQFRAHHLLKNCPSVELKLQVDSRLERETVVWALCYALLDHAAAAEAVHLLHDGDAALVGTFWEEFQLLTNEEQRRSLLKPLFPASAAGAKFLNLSLHNGCRLRPETLEWVLNSFGALKKEWVQHWLAENNLGALLDVLRNAGEGSESLWARLVAQLDSNLLVPGDAYQQALLMELGAAKDRPGPGMPAQAAQTIADWILVREHFETASAMAETSRPALIAACNRLGLDALQLLSAYCNQFVLPRGFDKEVVDDFAGFFHNFSSSEREYQAVSCRLLWWLRLLEGCSDQEQRALYQSYYFDNHVPLEFRWRLAEESHATGKLLASVYESAIDPRQPATTTDKVPQEVPNDGYSYQITGLNEETAGAPLMRSLLGQIVWLLPTLAGVILAVVLCASFSDLLRKTPALTPFLIVIYALAEAVAFLSVCLAVRKQARTNQPSAGPLGSAALAGLVGLGGVVLGGYIWDTPLRLLACVGGSIAAGSVLAALVGTGLPYLLRRRGWEARLSAGAMARPLAGVAALLLYFGLASWLLG
jgi:hypothetical protein